MNARASVTHDDSVEIKVLIDQVKSLEASLVGSRIGSTFIVLLAVWVFHDHVSETLLLTWLVAQIIFNGGHLWFGLRSRRVPTSAQNAGQRLRNSVMFSLISGLLWGGGVLMLWMPGNFEKQLIVIFFIVGMASGSMHALNAYLPSFFSFLVPCVGSVIVASLFAADQYSVVVSLATASHLVTSIQYVRGIHRTLINSIRKHHEADGLALKLQIQKDIAESATLAKSRFLAAASHDLRQPMHALNLYLGALAHFDLPLAARPVLASVRECAGTMDEMFRAMLDISRLDASVLIAKDNVFPIALVLDKIHTEFIQQAQEKGVLLRVARCSANVSGDQELIANILRNLVSNALRYTRQGKILLGCRRIAGGLRIAVYDTGIGIAPDQKSLVFEEFYQVGNRERDRSKGLGLGLAIVQRQAQLMNVPLTLSSQLGCGSVFTIEVPRVTIHSATIASRHAMSPSSKNILSGKLIAIVDDEAQILHATRLLLTQWGCIVIAATSGPEILMLCTASLRMPDAIICDHRLREHETGIDVIKALRRKFNHDIPALLITGDTSPEQIKTILAAGLPVLHKPLQAQVLQETLLRLIEENEMHLQTLNHDQICAN